MKTLVVYFSAQNHTKRIAEKVAENLKADIYEITPEAPYTEEDMDWMEPTARCTMEHNDESLRDIKLKNIEVENWDSYERVIILYPIWWGIAAWAANSFVKTKDWNGKLVRPVATSHSSDLGDSDKLLSRDANGGDWKPGIRFSQDVSDDEIKTWTDNIAEA